MFKGYIHTYYKKYLACKLLNCPEPKKEMANRSHNPDVTSTDPHLHQENMETLTKAYIALKLLKFQ